MYDDDDDDVWTVLYTISCLFRWL